MGRRRSFVASESETEMAVAWIAKHKCSLRQNIKKNMYKRSISWIFTDTSIGTAIEVSCSCGKKANVTDYGSW